MDRPGPAAVLRELLGLLPGLLLLGGIGALMAAPPVALAAIGLGWLPAALGAVLLLAGVGAALLALVDGLRRRHLAVLLDAGAWAALGAGAVAVVSGLTPVPSTVLIAALLLAASATTRRSPPLADDRSARLSAAAIVVAVGVAVVIGLLPESAAVLDDVRVPILLAAVIAAAAAGIAAPRTHAATALLLGAGAAGLAADRGMTLEALAALAALVGAALAAATATVTRPPDASGEEDEADRLPELAARLADGVLRFDGGLRLREWNAAAASLLGLEPGSVGMRAEDIMGVSLAQLPDGEVPVAMPVAVGGLEVVLHRSGGGVIAVVRDPGARPEAERLAQELRSTIEELLRARRTIHLQRGELERAASVDALTGVSSRGAIMERLRTEVAQARRYRHPLAVVLIDIDGFSGVNQQHGQASGDAVLREVALRFRLRLREADGLGRFGDDGFIAVLPHTDAEGAATFADALRHRLSMRPIDLSGTPLPITISAGVATMDANEDLDLDGLLARVQEALDSATRAGGDRIALDRRHGFARLEDRSQPHRAPPPADEGAV